jgi:hypothetical protein
MIIKKLFLLTVIAAALCSCNNNNEPDIIAKKPDAKQSVDTLYIKKAEATFDKMFELFWYDRMKIMYDKYPNLMATNTNTSSYPYEVGYAFVWGYGSVLSAYNTIFQHSPDFSNFEKKYKDKIKDGLEIYYNTSKKPAAYACFPNDWDDRFYDDNIWLGIDLVELYDRTKDTWYLDKAKIVWNFVLSGKDDVLGGGIYWKEGDKTSKNTCSNAPAAVLGLKLYQTTKDESYLNTSKEIYEWTKKNLQDPADHLYWDNIKTNGTIEKPKFSYNAGQMLQAAVLLYNVTKNEKYLNEARLIAESAYNYYFEKYSLPTGETITVLKKGSLWFHAIMFRGFAELHPVDKNMKYLSAFKQSLDHAWRYARDAQSGLFSSDMSGRTTDNEKDLLTQGGIIEMYARFATLQ